MAMTVGTYAAPASPGLARVVGVMLDAVVGGVLLRVLGPAGVAGDPAPLVAPLAAAVAAVVAGLVAFGDLRHAIGFSSFGVLVYYAVANLSAWTQGPANRRRPRVVQALGIVGCLTLVATLPIASVVTGVAVLGLGLVGRAALRR